MFACMSVHVYSVLGAGRERLVNVKELQMVVAILWLLGTEPRSSGRASSAFEH